MFITDTRVADIKEFLNSHGVLEVGMAEELINHAIATIEAAKVVAVTAQAEMIKPIKKPKADKAEV